MFFKAYLSLYIYISTCVWWNKVLLLLLLQVAVCSSMRFTSKNITASKMWRPASPLSTCRRWTPSTGSRKATRTDWTMLTGNFILFIFSLSSVYLLFIFYSSSIYLLFIFYLSSIYLLVIFYLSSIYLLFIFYSSSIHLLFIFYSSSIYLLFIFYLSSIHLLFIFYLSSTYLLFIFYSSSIHLLFIFYSSSIYLLTGNSILFILTSTNCNIYYTPICYSYTLDIGPSSV